MWCDVRFRAKPLTYGLNNLLDDDEYILNKEESQIYHSNGNVRRSPVFDLKLLNPLRSQDNILNEYERGLGTKRRAQAIVKGDPREFMG